MAVLVMSGTRLYLRGLFVSLRSLIFVGFLEVVHTSNVAFYILQIPDCPLPPHVV